MNFPKPILLSALALAATLTAQADFSYTTTAKATGGSMAAMAGAAMNQTSTTYLKGDKYASVNGAMTTILDFGAQTVTSINNTAKTYTVKKFSDLAATGGATVDATADVKETGQKKTVNGFDASEMVLTMDMDMTMGTATMKMKVEMHMWVSPDVPGAANLRDFYKKNAANFPWAALASAQGGTGNASVQKALSTMQRKLAEMNGVPVEEVIEVKSGDGGAQMAQMPAMPQMTPQQQAQMQAAMAKMQAAQGQTQGNPQASAAMQQAMAMMANMGRGPAAAGGSASGNGSLIEITMDSSKFSTDSVPDSVFAIPAGYAQK